MAICRMCSYVRGGDDVARPLKDGIDYFPLDAEFLQDKKIRLIKSEFGAKGVLVVIQILCSIYKENGYFSTCDDDDCFFMAEAVGCGVDSDFIRQVIHGCVRRSLFDDKLFNVFGVLTSRGIQRRFLRAAGTRDNIYIFEEYWLLDVNNKKDVPASILKKITFKNVYSKETTVNLQNNDSLFTNQTLKESRKKVKERKEEDNGALPPESDDNISLIFQTFEYCGFMINGYTRDELIDLADEYEPAWVVEAIKRAADRGKKNLGYVKGILNKWQVAGAMDNGKTEAKQEEKPQERPPAYKVFDTNEPKKEKTQMPEELRRKIHEMF